MDCRGHLSKNIKYFDDHAQQMAESYLSVTTEETLPFLSGILDKYENSQHNALDIGCGSGRDASWLSRKGWKVDAVDGSESFVRIAKENFSTQNINFFRSRAPDFSEVLERGKSYNLILMAAFIFHFNEQVRKEIYVSVIKMLSDYGCLHITIRNGPPPTGRETFQVNLEELEQLATSKGLIFVDHGTTKDALGRGDVNWKHISLWRGKWA